MPYQPPTAQRRPRIDQADFGWAEAVAELSQSLKDEHARGSTARAEGLHRHWRDPQPAVSGARAVSRRTAQIAVVQRLSRL
jgi:hypothetical protein